MHALNINYTCLLRSSALQGHCALHEQLGLHTHGSNYREQQAVMLVLAYSTVTHL